MDIRIGITQTPRELVIETEDDAASIEKQVTEALTTGVGVLALTDTKGKKVLVSAAKLAYVEIGTPTNPTVGFRA